MNQNFTLTDGHLVLLLQKKDEKALNFLYDKYAAGIYGLILRQVNNERIAAQILSRTFLKIWQECHSYDCLKQNLFPWIFGIAGKIARTEFDVVINPNLKMPPRLPQNLSYAC